MQLNEIPVVVSKRFLNSCMVLTFEPQGSLSDIVQALKLCT